MEPPATTGPERGSLAGPRREACALSIVPVFHVFFFYYITQPQGAERQDMQVFDIRTAEFEKRFEHEKAVAFTEADFDAPAKAQVIRVLPGERIKPHHHAKRTEMFHIVSGEGEIKLGGVTAATSTMQLVLCKPGTVHEFINTSRTEPLTIAVFRTNDAGNEDMIWEDPKENESNE